MPFAPVRDLEDLDTLDHNDVLDGYFSAERGDPEPGDNRGRAFWHGWRNRMIDLGLLPHDEASEALARAYLIRIGGVHAIRRTLFGGDQVP